MEHKQGPFLLFVTGLGEAMKRMGDVSVKEVGAWVSIIAGSLAAFHYAIIIYEKLFKKKKTIS